MKVGHMKIRVPDGCSCRIVILCGMLAEPVDFQLIYTR